MKEFSENLQANDVVESSSLVSSVMKVKKESDAFDARPEAEKGNNTHNSSPINLKSSSNSEVIAECKEIDRNVGHHKFKANQTTPYRQVSNFPT